MRNKLLLTCGLRMTVVASSNMFVIYCVENHELFLPVKRAHTKNNALSPVERHVLPVLKSC